MGDNVFWEFRACTDLQFLVMASALVRSAIGQQLGQFVEYLLGPPQVLFPKILYILLQVFDVYLVLLFAP